MEYTAAQRAAIGTLDDPLLIVACAGSGKTQVISQRIVEILRRPDVEPKNIVAFTFTEKAAAELKERVTNLVTAEFGDMIGLAELFIGTMHGYALRRTPDPCGRDVQVQRARSTSRPGCSSTGTAEERPHHHRRRRQRAAEEAASAM